MSLYTKTLNKILYNLFFKYMEKFICHTWIWLLVTKVKKIKYVFCFSNRKCIQGNQIALVTEGNLPFAEEFQSINVEGMMEL